MKYMVQSKQRGLYKRTSPPDNVEVDAYDDIAMLVGYVLARTYTHPQTFAHTE